MNEKHKKENKENYMSQSMLWWSVDVRKYETCYPF